MDVIFTSDYGKIKKGTFAKITKNNTCNSLWDCFNLRIGKKTFYCDSLVFFSHPKHGG
jgi:hypothetical protein